MALGDLLADGAGWHTASCPMCDSDDRTVAFRDRNRRERLEIEATYVRCRACRTLFLDPTPSDAVLAEAYAHALVDPVEASEGSEPPLPQSVGVEALKAPSTRSWIAERLRPRPHEWPRGAGQGRRLLDFGCNGGDKVASFVARGWQVFGVDLNGPAIARARMRFPGATFFAGSVDDLPADLRFDIIRMDNVLEHLPDPAATLRALRTRLLPGGALYIYVPNALAFSIALLGGGSVSSWIPFHLFLPSDGGLRGALVRAGFQRVRTWNYTPISWGRLSAAQALGRPLSAPASHAGGAVMTLGLALSIASMVCGIVGRGEELVVEAVC